MRILYNPLCRNEQPTVTATNAGLNYPPENIYHPFIKARYQAVTDASVLTITFSVDQSINCFFYGKHNLSELTAVFKDSGGGTLDTVVVGTIADIGVEYFTQIDLVRSIELTCATASAYLKFGGFDCGIYYQMPNFINSWPIKSIDNSMISVSLGGQVSVDNISKLNGYKFKFIEIIKTIMDEIILNCNTNGRRPIYIDLTESNNNFLAPLYCIVNKSEEAQKTNRRFSFDLEITEAN